MNHPATIQRILTIQPHPNADRLEIATVLGYSCVVLKGIFKAGDLVVFIEPDSVLPDKEWALPYKKGSRVRAIKLRDEWSFGIVLPVAAIPALRELVIKEGESVSQLINVIHYEPPAPQELNAKRSTLPFQKGKTDEDRYESVRRDKIPFGELVDITYKCDGQSAGYYYDLASDTFGVCSRGQELKPECPNNYTSHVARYDIENKLRDFCKKTGKSLFLWGESYGGGICGHKHNLDAKKPLGFMLFNVWDIATLDYYHKGGELYFDFLGELLDIPRVPIIEKDVVLTEEHLTYYSEGIDQLNGAPFEGVVVKHARGSFKIVNKYYDAKK